MRIIFLLLLVLSFIESCVPTYIDRIKVTTTYHEPVEHHVTHIKSLLILAKGNISTRVVSTNFHSAIQDLMKKNGSKTRFEFKHANTINQKNEINSSPTSYDGYMLLTSRDTATIDHYRTKFLFAAPLTPRAQARIENGNAFKDIILIELYNKKKVLIYTGEISFRFDPAKDALYKIAAKKVITQLSNSNIELW